MQTNTMTAEVVKAAREWIAECAWRDMDPEDIDALSDAQVMTGIARHYSGGIPGFLATF